MQWNDPREQGNVPGKLFEYLGTGRPILLLGLEGGVPDVILRERNAGVLCNSPEAIATQLRAWLAMKASTGSVAEVDPTARSGFSRREQYEKLRTFLDDLFAEQRSIPIAGPTTIREDTGLL
jgi:glycosyltransferase involved in cell wall biosynthesis